MYRSIVQAFTDADVLHQELMDHLDRPVEFYVYNTDTDEVRVVVLMPTEVKKVFFLKVCSFCHKPIRFVRCFANIMCNTDQDWGGEGERGVLGANVAYGYLHVLPAHCCQTIGM